MARRFNKQQPQIIAACDFKHLEYEEVSGESQSSNGALIEFRTTIRTLGEAAVATFIQGFRDVVGDSGTATGIAEFDSVDIYSQQLAQLEEFFGANLDGTGGKIAVDIAELNSILSEFETAVGLMNFVKITADTPIAGLLEGYYDTEKAAIVSDTQANFADPDDGGNYYTKLRPNVNYPGSYSGYMQKLGFSEGVGENFSSTKWFIQLLQGIGFSARRFVPTLCTEGEITSGRSDDTGAPYCIFAPTKSDPDILEKLSVVAGDKFGGNMPYFYPTSVDDGVGGVRAADSEDHWSKYFDQVNPGAGGLDSTMQDLCQIEREEQGLARLFMLLSRELSNSAGLAYYQDADQSSIRERLESSSGVTISKPSPEDGSTYSVDSTNLFRSTSRKSPFGTQYSPCDVTSTAVTIDGVAPNPKGFVTCEVDEGGFPGNVTGKTRCSLFEPNGLAMADGDFIAGTRDFFLAAFFDKDEVIAIRETGGVLGDHPDLSRLTRTQHEFDAAMLAYRDYIIDMTALQDVEEESTTTPRAIVRRLFCNASLESLLGSMTDAAFIEEPYVPEEGTLDGDCFVAGTRIAIVADGVLGHMFIEDVGVGVEVLSYNFSKGKVEPRKVVRTMSPIHSDIVEFAFSDGTFTKHTFDHPYYVVGEGWSSYAPDLTISRYKHEDLRNTRAILVGDECMTVDGGTVKLVEINEQASEPTQTYNFNVEGNENYFADDVLVHNKTKTRAERIQFDTELIHEMGEFEVQGEDIDDDGGVR